MTTAFLDKYTYCTYHFWKILIYYKRVNTATLHSFIDGEEEIAMMAILALAND